MTSGWHRSGALIAGIAAVVLLLVTFALPWFGVEGATLPYLPDGENEVSAAELAFSDVEIASGSLWETTSFLDILVAICCVGVLIVAALGLRGGLSETSAKILAVLGTTALVLVLYVAVAPPNNLELDASGVLPFPAEPGVDLEPIQIELSRQIGVFTGILAALGMTAGGVMAVRRRRALT